MIKWLRKWENLQIFKLNLNHHILQKGNIVTDMKTKIYTLLFFILIISYDIFAQCAMCRAIPSSNQEAGGNIANGLNTGILYLMAVPYLLIMGFIAFYFREKIKAFYFQMFAAK